MEPEAVTNVFHLRGRTVEYEPFRPVKQEG